MKMNHQSHPERALTRHDEHERSRSPGVMNMQGGRVNEIGISFYIFTGGGKFT
jgi:hypothetical protein